jgi:hypothetical protein
LTRGNKADKYIKRRNEDKREITDKHRREGRREMGRGSGARARGGEKEEVLLMFQLGFLAGFWRKEPENWREEKAAIHNS